MKYDPDLHRRRSIRLRDYDYSVDGAYFVTICTNDRKCLFGKILNGKMILNDHGKIAAREWLRTEKIRKNIKLDAFTVMPNHIHGIVIISTVGAYCNTPLSICNTSRSISMCNTPLPITPTSIDGTSTRIIGTPLPINNTPIPIAPPQTGNIPPPIDNTHNFFDTASQQIENTFQCFDNTPPQPKPLRSPANNLGSIIRGYKSTVAKQINVLRDTPGTPIWQRNYYEHIVRDENDMCRIREYIRNNPANWQQDSSNIEEFM